MPPSKDPDALAFECFDALCRAYDHHGQHFIAALGAPDGRVFLGSTQKPEELASILRGLADQLDGGSGGALIHLGFRREDQGGWRNEPGAQERLAELRAREDPRPPDLDDD